MSHVGNKPREATIFGFTSVVQIAKWLLHDFKLKAVFLLGVWQGFSASVEASGEALGKALPNGPLVSLPFQRGGTGDKRHPESSVVPIFPSLGAGQTTSMAGKAVEARQSISHPVPEIKVVRATRYTLSHLWCPTSRA
jgi:hypothetical protein